MAGLASELAKQLGKQSGKNMSPDARQARARYAVQCRWARVRGENPPEQAPDALALVASLRGAITGLPGWQQHDLRLAGIADWLASLHPMESP